MSDIKSVIERLKKVDLSKYPKSEIIKLIQETGISAHMRITLPSNSSVFRARLNDNNDHFYSKCELTYKPQHYNKSYQRASTPDRTMFYGSFLPDN